MTRLQVELILALLLDDTQVRSQRRLGNCLGIVVVVLLPLQERFDVNRRDDPRLVPQRAEHPADEVRAQTVIHRMTSHTANQIGRPQLLCLDHRRASDAQTIWALGEMRWPTMGEARLDVGKSGAFSRFSGQPAGPTPAAARTTRFTGQPRKVHQIVTTIRRIRSIGLWVTICSALTALTSPMPR
jgi:hypothetical protein